MFDFFGGGRDEFVKLPQITAVHALQVETVYGRGYMLRLVAEAREAQLLQTEWSV